MSSTEYGGTSNRDRSPGTRLRSVYYDSRPFVWITLALTILGVAFLVVTLTSPGAWEWWNAKAVAGTEQGGVVYYTYHGGHYSVDDPTGLAQVSRPRTVYVDPANPSTAVLGIMVPRISDSLFVGGPFVAAIAFFCAALIRHGRIIRTREAHPDGEFGYGLAHDAVALILARQRADKQPGPGSAAPD